MNYTDEAINQAIHEGDNLRHRIKKRSSVQVTGAESDFIRATALTWFNNHRKKLRTIFSDADFAEVDAVYQAILLASHKATSRTKYVSNLKTVAKLLADFRTANVLKLSAAPENAPAASAHDDVPDFRSLVKDDQMRAVLERRWIECATCIQAGAPLSAVVMVGGFLEGLLLARVHRETNKAPIFTAKTAPRDGTGKTKTLNDWTLQNYIDVAHELKWITVTVKDVGEVLRDYRNFIHPYKELSEQLALKTSDAALLWAIGKTIATQVLSSTP